MYRVLTYGEEKFRSVFLERLPGSLCFENVFKNIRDRKDHYLRSSQS